MNMSNALLCMCVYMCVYTPVFDCETFKHTENNSIMITPIDTT